MRYAIAAALLLAAAGPAAAQVGYPPQESPYQDVEFRQDFSVYTGYFNAGEDKVGVAPRSGPMFGARYDVRIAGPAWFTARVAGVLSEREVIDPTRSAATRRLGTESTPLYLLDAGITLHLTGQKSWHRLIPTVGAGIGLVSDFESEVDVGDYRLGTPFAFNFGAGVRYVPGGRWSFRAEVTDYLYKITYPSRYQDAAIDGTRVLDEDDSRSDWTSNLGLTLGASFQLFR